MIAPDQCGVNPGTGVASYGHSMAIGPWGEVLALAGEEEAALTVTLTPAELAQARNRVPALRHRRR
jgi:predicted amidohydrolase